MSFPHAKERDNKDQDVGLEPHDGEKRDQLHSIMMMSKLGDCVKSVRAQIAFET